tara:strand:- start:150 stop:875 length:726 start_codon:yes stop_codon:yes gene_type:complete
MNSAIPENLASDISAFTSSLEKDLGDSLVSVVLYGGLVKNEMIKESDRVKIMVVIKDVKISNLDKVGDALLSTKRAGQIQLLTLTPLDLNSSTDVFPIKFLDMQQDYEILHGDDVVKDLEVGRDHLRIRCEQEIKNLMLKLRSMYLHSRKDTKVLQKILLKAYYSFLQSGDALAELKTGKVYRKENEVLEGIESIGLDSALMKKIQELRSSDSDLEKETLQDLYEQFMEMIVKAAEMADQV